MFRKYLIVLDNDKKWGFYLNNIGRTVIDKYDGYPSKNHPENYTFTWDKGRILNEFHLVLITNGEGIFESEITGQVKISHGDTFFLFPGIWHRYKPKKEIGWTEHWIGFSGNIAHDFMRNGFLNAKDPIISKCDQHFILNHFNTLFKLFDEQPFGYQRIASGVCLQLIAELYNIKSGGTNIDNLNSLVTKAKHTMYRNIDKSINLRTIASSLGVSYSKFRIDFKTQTGISPLQYYILIKIEKSKELLLNTNKSQKEIAYELGFESDVYFNRLFKRKTGVAPGKYRNLSKNNL
ncbi:helix-turn-helix domain-containing protein [Jejuia pallidilutea]|nr:AraC family transcriptional regulator [Jejuia pallidilutea]